MKKAPSRRKSGKIPKQFEDYFWRPPTGYGPCEWNKNSFKEHEKELDSVLEYLKRKKGEGGWKVEKENGAGKGSEVKREGEKNGKTAITKEQLETMKALAKRPGAEVTQKQGLSPKSKSEKGCEVCNAILPSADALKVHQENAHFGKKCWICHEYQKNLDEHVRLVCVSLLQRHSRKAFTDLTLSSGRKWPSHRSWLSSRRWWGHHSA